MKAFLIDPFAKTITQVEHSGDYKEIYKLCDFDTFTVVYLENEDVIYVDDEGLLKPMDSQMFFAVQKWHPEQAFAGKGLVLGTDSNGASQGPKITLDELKKNVMFLTPEDMVLGFL